MYGRIDLGTGSLTNKTSGGQGRTETFILRFRERKKEGIALRKEHHRFGVSISEEQKRIVGLKMKGQKTRYISFC
jgi:hypothetical protein